MGPKTLPKPVAVKSVVKAPVKAAVKAPAKATVKAPTKAPDKAPTPAPSKDKKKKTTDLEPTGPSALDAGKAQLDAGIAVVGTAAASAAEAFQGLWGGLAWPAAEPPPEPKKKVKRPPDVTPALPPPRPAAAQVAAAVSIKKAAQYSPVSTDFMEVGDVPVVVDISGPRKRPPGKPPCTSAEDLRRESKVTPVAEEQEETLLVTKRDMFVNGPTVMKAIPFNELRQPSATLHPSVRPRQSPTDPRNTAIVSEIVDDPTLVTAGRGIDKVLESRQFIEAMKRNLGHGKTRPRVESTFVNPVVPDAPISPSQDHISTVAFLPSPTKACRRCGLYETACICETVDRVSRYRPPDSDPLSRLFNKLLSRGGGGDDDEGSAHTVGGARFARMGAAMRDEGG